MSEASSQAPRRRSRGARLGGTAKSKVSVSVNALEVERNAPRKGPEGLSDDTGEQSNRRAILQGQERRIRLINRGYICYRRARGWMAIVRSRVALAVSINHCNTPRPDCQVPYNAHWRGTSRSFHLGQIGGSRSSTFDRINLPYYRQFGYVFAEILGIIVVAMRELIVAPGTLRPASERHGENWLGKLLIKFY